MDNVSYVCKDGFEKFSGNSSRVCNHKGDWTGQPLSCTAKQCTMPAKGTFASLSVANLTFNSTASYTCLDGYEYAFGNMLRICQSDGQWSGSELICRAGQCERYTVPNSVVSPSGRVDVHGSVFVTCNPGFVLHGYSTWECNSMLKWVSVGMRSDASNFVEPGTQLPTETSCLAATCGTPDRGVNSDFTLVTRSQADYRCYPGYKRVSGARRRNCVIGAGSLRSWSEFPLTCTARSCGYPGEAHNAVLVSGQEVTYNSTLMYQCLNGHTLVNGSLSITCDEKSETWSNRPPRCEALICQAHLTGENSDALLSTKGSFAFGQVVHYVCKDGFARDSGSTSLQCIANDTWSEEALNCVAKQCKVLKSNPNSAIQMYSAGDSVPVNTTITYTCNAGYRIAGMSTTQRDLRCLSNTLWNGVAPMCEDVDECEQKTHNCTGSGEVCMNTIGGFDCQCEAGSVACNCRSSKLQCPLNSVCDESNQCSCSAGYLRVGATCHVEASVAVPATSNIAFVAIAAVLGILAAIFAIVAAYLWRSRRELLKRPPTDNSTVVNNPSSLTRSPIPHDSSSRSSSIRVPNDRDSLRPESVPMKRLPPDVSPNPLKKELTVQMPTPNRPRSKQQLPSARLDVSGLAHAIQDPESLIQQFKSVSTNLATSDQIPPGTETKNRYTNVLPNPATRVALRLKYNEPNSDYINANYIRGYGGAQRKYIATQGPMYSTIPDFWRMVWEQKASVIIMVTGLEERGVTKCARYWPMEENDNLGIYDDMEVLLREKTVKQDYTITKLWITNVQTTETREVQHWWFTAWPDFGVPVSPKSLLVYLIKVKSVIRLSEGPVIVHCSAGIGRTGTVICCDICMQEMDHDRHVDILHAFATMRQDRGGMVQTKDQYKFIFQAMLEYGNYLASVGDKPKR